MPLTAESPHYLHILQNVALLSIAVLFIPINTFIALGCLSWSLLSRWTARGQDRTSRGIPKPTRPRVILVTGVGMSKGLFIARAFQRRGHTVIGADFEPSVPVCGRFSSALSEFYTLPSSPSHDSAAYVAELIAIINRHGVDLWVSCSGVLSAVQDGEAADAIWQNTSCKPIQFGSALTQILHEKDSFIEHTQRLGLNVPETHRVCSVAEAMQILERPETLSGKKQFILKSVGVDDSVRADMTLLPFQHPADSRSFVKKLRPSATRPFVLQQFIRGEEYCTHAIVIHGQVTAFTCCQSADLLMHYVPLALDGELAQAMLQYTQDFIRLSAREHGQMTGHFSLDFLVDGENRLYPIECNPRTHTAVVNFDADIAGMVDAYMSVFDDAASIGSTIFTSSSSTSHYWIGHDLVTRVFLPLLQAWNHDFYTSRMFRCWREFFEHLAGWRDPTYDILDPLPAWWLYSVYWPGIFFLAAVQGTQWSKCNVSTGKVFKC